ncbi:MAG: PAS domain S-box protein [Candidatus Delongbacteria bacterium]
MSAAQPAPALPAGLLDDLFTQSALPLVILDPLNLELLAANPAAARLYGWPDGAALRGRPLLELLAPDQPGGEDSRTALARRVQEAEAGGLAVFEWLHQRPDGGRWMAEVQLMPLCAGKRRLLHLTLSDLTPRRRAEDALRLSQAQLLATLENTPHVATQWFDRQGRVRFWNRASETLFGWSAGEALGRTLEDLLYSPAEGAAFREMLARIEATGQPCGPFESPFHHRDGHAGWLLSTTFAIPMGEGEPGFVCMDVDISERKAAEAALRLSEEKFAGAFRASPDAISLSDPATGRLVEVNEGFTRQLGWTRAEAVGRPSRELKLWADPAERDRFLVRLRAEGHLRDVEARVRRRDGTLIDMRLSAETLRVGDEELLLLIARDVTEQKRAEEDLQREREFTQALLDSVPGMIYLYDESGRLVRWNRKHSEWTGFSDEELLGRSVLDWYPDEETRTRVVAALERMGTQGHGEVEAELTRKDGSRAPFYLTGVPVTIGGRSYFTGIGIDISERLKAEQEQARLRDQLQQAQKMESIGRLAGGVAHDFNNMLGVILGHAELALAEVPAEQSVRADLEEIHKAARRSADLTRQLLAFARKQAVAPRKLDLSETVAGMLKMLKRLIGEDIDLSWRPGAPPLTVHMDPSQLDQLLANLCVNARDAIRGVGKVTIETRSAHFDQAYCDQHADSQPGNYVLLAVSDDGCGMDKEVLSHLFEPFFTTKALGQGTGLGLATVYGIVRQNQGFVNVYSEPGQGTTFRIYLPALGGEAEPTAGDAGEAPRGRGETVLLVEDEAAILNLCRSMLEGLGYQVLACGNPRAALELARQSAGVDLLLTDVIMPEMNGRDLAAALAELAPGLRCVYMSGYTANVIAHHGVLDPHVVFLQKPFSIRDLALRVRQALDGPPEPIR